MGIETADGKQNFKLTSILFFSECINKSKQTNFLTLRKLFWEA